MPWRYECCRDDEFKRRIIVETACATHSAPKLCLGTDYQARWGKVCLRPVAPKISQGREAEMSFDPSIPLRLRCFMIPCARWNHCCDIALRNQFCDLRSNPTVEADIDIQGKFLAVVRERMLARRLLDGCNCANAPVQTPQL